MGDQSLESTQRSMKYLLALLAPALVAAEADPGYGYAPQVYCRDTNTSVYAQVCVPAFTSKVTPVTLDIKKVVDNDYCYEQIRTVCEETTKVQPRKICTYKYNSVKETLGAQTTQVTYETKTETFKVPLVTEPLEVSVDVAAPQPEQVCVDQEITITEVVCKDIKEEKCFNVAKFEDATTTIDQTEIVLGEPNCADVPLTLPTQAF